jgi:hypothetical protein
MGYGLPGDRPSITEKVLVPVKITDSAGQAQFLQKRQSGKSCIPTSGQNEIGHDGDRLSCP